MNRRPNMRPAPLREGQQHAVRHPPCTIALRCFRRTGSARPIRAVWCVALILITSVYVASFELGAGVEREVCTSSKFATTFFGVCRGAAVIRSNQISGAFGLSPRTSIRLRRSLPDDEDGVSGLWPVSDRGPMVGSGGAASVQSFTCVPLWFVFLPVIGVATLGYARHRFGRRASGFTPVFTPGAPAAEE
jgi:hypothetical protein